MSVIIKGMSVPTCCEKCFAFQNDYPWDPDHSYFCRIKKEWMEHLRASETKPSWCPLEEAPKTEE